MKASVILFPGSNREQDAARALRQATGQAPSILWHGDHDLPAGTDLVVLPGGFSYGDYLRCGAIAARSPIMRAVSRHVGAGRTGAWHLQRFPDSVRGRPAAWRADAQRRPALHLPDAASSRGERRRPASPAAIPPDRWSNSLSRMARAISKRDDATIKAIEGNGQVAFRYCDADGPGGRSVEPQRFGKRHRGRLQRSVQRTRPDAASGEPDRSAGRRGRRPPAVRGPGVVTSNSGSLSRGNSWRSRRDDWCPEPGRIPWCREKAGIFWHFGRFSKKPTRETQGF